MTDISNLDIFSVIGNSTRLDILSKLSQENLKLGQLSQKMEMTIQALQKHIDKLSNSGLIEKNNEGILRLSSIGKVTLEQIPSFQFLSKNKKFFDEHNFDGIPKKLLLRIGDLSNADFVEEQMQAWQNNKNMCLNTKNWLYSVTVTVPIEFLDIAKEILPHGVQFRMLYGKNTYVPKGFYDCKSRNDWEDAIKTGQVQEKFIEKVPITMVNTESQSVMVFSNTKLGEPDTMSQFAGSDANFNQWCLDLFNYYWNEVPSVEPFKLQER